MLPLYVISGHGAGDPGAGGNGYNEADVVRQISSRLKALGGSDVVELDKSINWYQSKRVDSALKRMVGGCPVLELHLDAANASAKGGHIIVRTTKTLTAADKRIVAFLNDYFPGRATNPVYRSDLGNANRAWYQGIDYTLIECCFITNSNDMKKLMGNMDAFCRGIINAYGISTTKNASWKHNNKGWWYEYADGSYPKNTWEKLDAWYYFDSRGYALENTWKKLNGYWYYFNTDCRMATKWKKVDGYWYYLNPSKTDKFPEGAAVTGWKKVNGFWYYLNPKKDKDFPECAMRTGWVKDKGDLYYLNPSKTDKLPEGAMVSGETLTIDGNMYSFDKDGRLK